ncbi:hypothetical protein BT93_L2078 [Corymbia citriodora subsp. variegata]|uniref:Uncharacterized protein n=1 Tax=Corymbia citriodora subsp. variegata TaxID=360336 RepID=A0A8T0CM99_CORYI|nr:hypothetical protein BT93_L2078 [Corymbia citriodora subsp. variegata]
MDYVGIAVMIITSFFCPIYHVSRCQPHWQLIYLGGIMAMGMSTVVTLLAPSLYPRKFRAFRPMLFSSMGVFWYCTCNPCLYCELEQPVAPDHACL